MMLAKRVFLSLMLGLICFFVFACGSSRSIRITDKFETLYKPNFDYNVSEKSKANFNYTIGIIETEFIQKNPRGWVYATPREKQYLTGFKREISNSLEKILISKGCKVSGPFTTYEEMTFPQRERCSFLIKPTIILDLDVQVPIYDKMPDVGGPNLEAYAYASAYVTVSGNAQMDYVILDPLTKEKLERHKLKTTEISLTYLDLVQGYYGQDGKPGNWEHLLTCAQKNPKFRTVYGQYYNSDNVSAKILDAIFNEFVPKAEKLISADEFNHLMKYKEVLKKKKRY